MQQQYWITKKAVQRKFGGKEDEHVTSSDAELDAKIEIFRSIAKTSIELARVIDQYQDRLYMLSQEEAIFGRFLKECGTRSKTTGKIITNTGKAFTYCSQQRLCVRLPLLRLQNEVNVFRARAISDMQNTLTAMEKERTIYRAALSWIKSVSMELDPDTGKGLERFRAAQTHVRVAKQNFDTLSMDSVQKIDLLAAARCNMFSHVLMSYLKDFRQFAEKTADTLNVISQALIQNPKYDFSVLKDLTNNEIKKLNSTDNEQLALEKHQPIFLTDDDAANNADKEEDIPKETHEEDNALIELETSSNGNLFNLPFNCNDPLNSSNTTGGNSLLQPIPISTTDLLGLSMERDKRNQVHNTDAAGTDGIGNKPTNSWIQLFTELDPLSNLDAFDMKLFGDRENFQQT